MYILIIYLYLFNNKCHYVIQHWGIKHYTKILQTHFSNILVEDQDSGLFPASDPRADDMLAVVVSLAAMGSSRFLCITSIVVYCTRPAYSLRHQGACITLMNVFILSIRSSVSLVDVKSSFFLFILFAKASVISRTLCSS